jgi:hypothetical protein
MLIRILLLCSVAFAVAYALTRRGRGRVQERQLARIHEEIRSLRRAVEAGTVDAEEYAVRADRIRTACEYVGVAVPELPARLPKPRERDS